MDVARPNAHKSLLQLHDEWSSCNKCHLGKARMDRGGEFVFGQGVTGAIMLIGEGPGVEEERTGVPFVGKSGKLLRHILKLIGMDDVYISNLVTCRSCSQIYEEDGLPKYRKNFQTKELELAFKDEPPPPACYKACLPRLHEEIYLVDPVVIVGLGGIACEALMGGHITITRDRGETSYIDVPGASFLPSLTEKKEAWARKSKGGLESPIEQNMVQYHFIPTLHPAYVERMRGDKGENSPLVKLITDLKKAQKTYESYREIVFGLLPTRQDIDVRQQLEFEEQQ